MGFCVGIPIAYLCGRYLTHLLYNVGQSNPWMLAGATICTYRLHARRKLFAGAPRSLHSTRSSFEERIVTRFWRTGC